MKRIAHFFSLLWKNDKQYGFIDASLAWELSGIFERFSKELNEWDEVK